LVWQLVAPKFAEGGAGAAPSGDIRETTGEV